MKKILLSTDSYHYAPTANGVCVEEIAIQLKKEGHEVHVLCFLHQGDKTEEIIEGIHVHRIEMDTVNKLRFLYEKKLTGTKQKLAKTIMTFINRMQACLFLHWFPMRNPFFCRRYTRKTEELCRKYKYDLIIASYSPFEAIYALYKLSEDINLKKCMYTLDSLSNLKQRFFLSPKFQDKKGWKWEQKIYDKCDAIINLRCHEKHYAQSRYDAYRDKMFISDIPHMIDFGRTEYIAPHNKLQFVYAGNFYADMIDDVYQVLDLFLKKDEIELHIYGRNHNDKLDQIVHSNKNIVNEGFKDREEILQIEARADILLSVGCPNTDFISSKIFEYVSFGGKVIHIYKGNNDPNVQYLREYKNGLCICIEDGLDVNRYKVESFLRLDYERIPFSELAEIYQKNMPEYTAQIINNII